MGNSRKKVVSSSEESSDLSEDDYRVLQLENKLLKRKLKQRERRNKKKFRRDVSSDDDNDEDDFELEKEDEIVPEPTDPLRIEFVEVPSSSLSGEILQILGTNQTTVNEVSEDIHKDLVVRWDQIIKKGLSKEDREELLKKYPRPKNFVNLGPPKINPELSTAIDEITKKRDEKLQINQDILVASITALGRALTTLLDENSKDDPPLAMIEPINDAAKLIGDLFKDQTTVRQNLISIKLGKEVKELAGTEVADGWLFGDNLAERIKTAKALKKSGDELKTSKFKKPLNYKEPSRRIPKMGSYNPHKYAGNTKPKYLGKFKQPHKTQWKPKEKEKSKKGSSWQRRY